MRKHRIFGVLIAGTLAAGVITQRPGPTEHSGLALASSDHDISSTASPVDVHPAVVSSNDLPQGLLANDAVPQAGDALVALASLLAPAPAPPPKPAPTPAPVVATPAPVVPAAAPVTPTPAPVVQTAAPVAPSGGVWLELRQCESGDNYAENSGNGYYGAYQFSAATWQALGYSGLPSDAPPAQQDAAAQTLQARSGWSQWPACSAKLGLD